MPAQVHVLLGPARAGKTSALLERYRRQLRYGAAGSALWLAPTQRGAGEVRDRLLDESLAACLAPSVMTFDQFAERIVAAAPRHVRPITELMKRELIARLLERERDEGRLTWFASIVGTQGLVDLVVQFTSELKRLEIWPETFEQACRRRGLSVKDRELVAIYQAYQDALVAHDLYDAEGRFWSAREILQDQPPRWVAGLELVVADGFTDFTRTQHEILELLGARAREILISLPWDDDADRRELFDKTSKTLAELRSRHAPIVEQRFSRAAARDWPAIDHLERQLFRNPRRIERSADARGIEIVAAAQAVGEIEEVARRIKTLLTDGDAGRPAPPGEIGVVVRTLAADAAIVREVFSEFGIPFAIEAGQPLAEAPPVAALVSLVKLVVDDWPFRQVLAVVNNGYIQPCFADLGGTRAVAAARHTVRELQVPSGRAELFDEIALRARRLANERDAADDPKRRERDQARLASAAAVLERLAAALDALPQRGTPAEWRAAIELLANALCVPRAMRQGDAAHAERDRLAWSRLLDGIVAPQILAERMREPPPSLDRRQLLELIHLVARTEQLPGDHDEAGRVRVLSASSARSVTIPYLFVACLTERSFPSREREDRLYSESEMRLLADQGLPLVLRSDRTSDEMLLFYEVVTRASRRLCLSYPSLDERAQELLPSPFLVEIEQAFEQGSIARAAASDLAPVPRRDEALSPRDYRVLAVARALDGEHQRLAALAVMPALPRGRADGALADNVAAALSMLHHREQREGFSAWEGVLESAEARRALAERFGGDRTWSPSELEDYAACPYAFFLRRVLGLAAPAEVALAADHPGRGRWIHDALVRLHREINARGGEPSALDSLDQSAYFELAEQVLADVFDGETGGETVAAAMAAIDKRRLGEWLVAYFDQGCEYDRRSKAAALAPSHFEVSFGLTRLGDDPLSRLDPLLVESGGETIRIAGRIDRLDIGQAGGRAVFNVIDYKSGKSPPHKPRDLVEAKALQLTLYAWAAESLLLADRGATAWQVGYWMLRGRGYAQALPLCDDAATGNKKAADWTALRTTLAESVRASIHSIRRGEFPVASRDEQCTGRCEFNTVCRIHQVRALEKTWQPSTDAT